MKYLVLFVAFLMFNPAPVEIKFLSYRGGKPPLKFNFISFLAKNESPKEKWFIIPALLDEPMPKLNELSINRIESYEYREENSNNRLVKVEFGYDHFAFLIPANSTLNIKSLLLESWAEKTPPPNFEIWIADDITINDSLSIKDWFPYDLKSSSNVNIQAIHNKHSDKNIPLNYDLEKKALRSDLQKEKVNKIKIASPQKHIISVES